MSEKIKVGLIGVGRVRWGMHTSELEKISSMFEITAACDLDLGRAEQLKRRIGADVHVTTDYRKLIGRSGGGTGRRRLPLALLGKRLSRPQV